MGLTRRTMLAGLLAGGTRPAWADAPEVSIRPAPRGPEFYKVAVPSADELIAEARLGGTVGFVVADAATGQVLEAVRPDLPQPPASTAKTLTSLYALDALGMDHRFTTRVLAQGPVENGEIRGDLVLAGGGDPVLDTDALGGLAATLKDQGIIGVTGALRFWDGALPTLFEIDGEQPDHVAYNPAISGLNLNFNRVHFGWERQGNHYTTSMDARSRSFRPAVGMARMRVIDRSTPVYTYADKDGRDEWTVARDALGNAGARWLPVRRPALYAADVFRTLLRSHGIVCDGPIAPTQHAQGEPLAEHVSPPLSVLLHDMLKYSTNLTAEVLGLHSSQSRGLAAGSLAQSAASMSDWLAQEYGLTSVALEDHSGLGDDSRISAADMVRTMVATGPDGALFPLLKSFDVDALPAGSVKAKTGTLNFVSALTGFLDGPDGAKLAFGIFCADTARRDALGPSERVRPEGGRAWLGRARRLQRALLSRWGTVYTG